MIIYNFIEMKFGSIPTVDSFETLEDAKQKFRERQEAIWSDYKRSGKIEDPEIFGNYIFENVLDPKDSILFRISKTTLNPSSKGSQTET